MKRTSMAKVALVALCVLAVSIPSLPSTAFHNPGIPLVESIPIDNPSYAAVRVNVPAGGGDISVEVQGTRGADGTMTSSGVWRLRDDGSTQFAFVFSSFNTGAEDQIQVGLPGAGTIVEEKRGGSGGFSGLATTARNLPEGEHVFLAIATTDASSFDGEINIYASEGVEYDLNTGDAFAYRPKDFDGLKVIHKNPNGPTWTKFIQQASVELDVQGNLYGLFQGRSYGQPAPIGGLEMSIDGPDPWSCGTVAGWCLTFIHNGDPGDWSINIDENIEHWEGNGFPPVVWFMGADVDLP